ncbi:MAG: LysE family translocator [Pseudomonadota bacterium]
MQQELIAALALYAFVTSITPGPNNVMLMTSGVNFGFRRTIPHMLGVGIGFAVMIIAVGTGVAGIFYSWPPAQEILRALSIAYLCWLAWKIATQPTDALAPGEAARPMTFLQAAAFQWVNPKAWTMALTSVSVYAPDQGIRNVLVVALVFGAINLPAVSSWTLIGLNISRLLGNPRHLRAFNVAMAVLLVLSLYPVIWP